MTGVVETDVLVKTLPTIVQGGMKLIAFGKTCRELTAAREEVMGVRKELAEKDKKFAAVEEQLEDTTTKLVAVTDELVQTRDKLSDAHAEYDNYRETMQL